MAKLYGLESRIVASHIGPISIPSHCWCTNTWYVSVFQRQEEGEEEGAVEERRGRSRKRKGEEKEEGRGGGAGAEARGHTTTGISMS